MVFVNLSMTEYQGKIAIKKVGKKLAEERRRQNYEITDIAEMAGLTYNTVSKMESGEDTLLSNFIEVCFALNLHPKEIINVQLNIKAKSELSPSRKEKSRLTSRIKNLIDNGNFNTWQGTKDIVLKLNEIFMVKTDSKSVSTILRRLHFEEYLNMKKDGRKNLYKIKNG